MASAPADRMRKHRERRREGLKMFSIPVSIDVAEVLIERGYLEVIDVHDKSKVAEALGKFLSDVCDSVTRNEITLDGW
jgi:hypothetical protein